MLTTPRVLFSFSLSLAFAAAPAAAQSSHPALVYATVQVGGAPFDLLLDLQVPAGSGPFPVVAWIHGGGWSGGSRLPIPGGVTRLLQRGYAVASIDYRLTGQAIWPASTVALLVPASPALRGLAFWWQAVATVSSAPFLQLSDGVERIVR